MKAVLFWFLFACVIGLVVWLIRKNRQLIEQRNQQFSVFARHEGWRFAPNPQYGSIIASSARVRTEDDDIAFTFDGRCEAFEWRMWYDANHRFEAASDDRSSAIASAIWLCQSVCTPELAMLILPRWQYRIESGRIFGAIASAANAFMAAVAETDDSDTRQAFFKRAVELKGALPGFADAFVVLVGPEVRRDWLDEELQGLLLHWPKATTGGKLALEASLGSRGLRIVFQRVVSDAWPFWKQFGQLGQAIGLRLVAGKAPATVPSALKYSATR
jgi:hypothetical protein